MPVTPAVRDFTFSSGPQDKDVCCVSREAVVLLKPANEVDTTSRRFH